MSGLLLWLWLSGAAAPELAGELSRLDGQRVSLAADGQSYAIEDIAGEGPPLVGVIERRGQSLWILTEGGAAYRLTGPLAIPRIAGPGYKVWVLGTVSPVTLALRARRLGVLAPPPR